MNCTDVATIMDEHAEPRLTTAERCALDDHLAGCEACTLAWQAQTALLSLPVPGTPRSLLDDVLRAVMRGAPTKPARAGARIVVASALLVAGAALAAAAFVTVVQRSHGDPAATSAAARAANPGRPSDAAVGVNAAVPTDAAALGASATRPPFELVDVEYFLVVRTPPDYPPEALARRLEGWVQVKFTIGENGAVEDATVVKSNEPMFERTALRAISNWKYLPRVVAGKRVEARDVQTVIRFMMAPDPPPNAEKKKDDIGRIPQPSDEPREDARHAAYVGVERGIAIAWERVAAEDLRGAELELDELRATYELDARQEGGLWDFYGYIFTQYGDYGRAIAAYESAIATYETVGGGAWQGERLALSNLYFARHQYDMALKTLLAGKKRNAVVRPAIAASAEREQSPKPLFNDGAEELIEKLRALGVTEETL